MLILHHCFCRLLGLKAQLSAELCPSFVNSNHFWCLILTGWGRTGNGILAEIGDSREWERKEPGVGVLKGSEVGEFGNSA